MNRKAYNVLQQESKRSLRESIKRFAEQNPKRFAELQRQAQHELEHPTPRTVTSHLLPSRLRPHFDADEFIRQIHTQSFYIHTKDCWGSEHLYFEALDGETPKEVLTRRHPKFVERHEEVIKTEKCSCPLCQALN